MTDRSVTTQTNCSGAWRKDARRCRNCPRSGYWHFAKLTSFFAAIAGVLFLAGGCDSSFSESPPNQAPNASFTARSDADDALTYTFDATGSGDMNTGGEIKSYEWEFGDGETATGRTVTHTFEERDRYDVTLTVSDDGGMKGSKTRTVVTGVGPEARFTATVSETYSTRYTFEAGDLGEDVVSYEWEFGDGETATGQAVTHTFDILEDQEFDVTLSVEDELGATDDTTQTISVEALEFIPISKDDWEVIAVDSSAIQRYWQGPNEGAPHQRFVASNAVDGDRSTFWNTQFRPDAPPEPHFITVDMGEPHRMYVFEIIGRRAFRGQNPKEVTIKFSDDGETWSQGQSLTTPMTFPSAAVTEGKVILPEPTEARYFRFIVTDNARASRPITQLNELNVFTSKADASP